MRERIGQWVTVVVARLLLNLWMPWPQPLGRNLLNLLWRQLPGTAVVGINL
jgi:hypothetical protein